MATVEVFIPLPSTQSSEWSGTTATYSVADKRVALVNNGWGSADDMVIVFEQALRERYGVNNVTHFKRNEDRPEVGSVGDARFVEDIARSSDVAITMLGNCGGCTAWTCNISAELERHGVRSAAVVTGLFEPLAAFTLAKTNKMPSHPLVVLSDHFEHTDPEKIEAAAVATLRTLFGEEETTPERDSETMAAARG
jgi:Fe-S cluster biogenesis protein NfuA